MKVLLHVDVPKLGFLGDVVEVKDGYARNYLLPQGIAVEPSAGNIKAIEEERAASAALRLQARKELEQEASKVEGAKVVISERANDQGHLFGSVTQERIAEALREAGFAVKAKHVVMSEHVRMLGEYEVSMKFAEDLKVSVKVEIVRPEVASDDEAQSAEPSEDAQPAASQE